MFDFYLFYFHLPATMTAKSKSKWWTLVKVVINIITSHQRKALHCYLQAPILVKECDCFVVNVADRVYTITFQGSFFQRLHDTFV